MKEKGKKGEGKKLNAFQQKIKDHLDQMAANDSIFAAHYRPEDIEGCCKHIVSEVKKLNRTAFADEEIFGMAVHYYDEGLTAPTSAPKCRVVVTNDSSAPKVKRPVKREKKENLQLDLFGAL